MKRFLLASLAALAVLGTTDLASANGRFPESNQIVFSKEDPNLVLLRVTFGLLVSHDKGKSFNWVCEQSIGYSGVEDPMYTVTPSGRYIATTFQGLSSSTNQACDWSIAAGDLGQQVFIDLATNPSDRTNVVAFASSYLRQDDAGNILFSSKLWETKDEGKSYAPLGDALDPSLLGYTVDFTTTDSQRLYLSAVRNPGPTGVGLLLTSLNHGQTWTEQEVPLTGTERALYIAAVDPTDAETVYLRTNNNPDQPGRLILRTKDPKSANGTAGILKTIYTGKAPLEAFALSPDGKTVWTGSPLDGVLKASTSDYQFTQQSTIEAKCLAVNDDGLWACSNEKIGFVAGLSKDEGKTFDPVLHFCGIGGPLSSCSQDSTTSQQCSSLWPAQRDTLGCGGGSDDGGPGDGTGTDVDGSVPQGGALTTTSKSCSCRAVLPSSGWSTVGGATGSVVALGLALARRRARRRR